MPKHPRNDGDVFFEQGEVVAYEGNDGKPTVVLGDDGWEVSIVLMTGSIVRLHQTYHRELCRYDPPLVVPGHVLPAVMVAATVAAFVSPEGDPFFGAVVAYLRDLEAASGVLDT